MTDQHPLTDEVIDTLASPQYDCFEDVGDVNCGFTYEDLRVATDWQLEEVMRKVELKLKEWRIQGYAAGADACEDFFEEVMQELRPQQQKRTTMAEELDWRDSIEACIAYSSRDWSLNHRDAWIYGVIVGYSPEGLAEQKQQHNWSNSTVTRLKKLHEQYLKETERPQQQENN